MPRVRLPGLPLLFCLLAALSMATAACTAGKAGQSTAGSPSRVTTARSTPGPTASLSAAPRVPKPPIVSKPIPFPDSRKDEMAAYARRHYGLDSFALVHPRAVVEHFTGTDSFPTAWETFASDSPDLGELPGTCAHFVVDTDGTIYQLVPLDIMCRHASGMNWTAFGIEMVGTSDRQILGNGRELGAALSLTLWLMDRFGIELRNVIGHNENLISPLRRELVASFRCQTHADWNHTDMETFLSKLSALAKRYDVPLGPLPRWVDIGC